MDFLWEIGIWFLRANFQLYCAFSKIKILSKFGYKWRGVLSDHNFDIIF